MICIFACDFSVFPEQHHKSDFYRNTLMDVGIGAFLFNNGCFYNLNTRNNAIRILSLFLLGFVRLLTLRLLNYSYNLAEYGRDLNFYFVLGSVYFLFPFIDSKHNFKFAFILSIFWEYLLRIYEFDLWIFSEYRKNWFNMNKEGIFAILPSLIIFMYANCLGKIAFYKTKLKENRNECKIGTQKIRSMCFSVFNTMLTNKIVHENDKLIHLCKYTGVFFYILYTSCKLSLSSRRLGNMCYTYWILFLHSFLILLTFVVNNYVNTEVFEIAEFLSRNMLAYFLWSNILVLFFSFFRKNYSFVTCHLFNIFYLALTVFVPFYTVKVYKKIRHK
ncbi:Glucosaminyl phosphatidylinositol (GlcN-PI) nositol acylation protein [Binucleata daphniae]